MNISLNMVANDDVTFGKVAIVSNEIKTLLSNYNNAFSSKEQEAVQSFIDTLQETGLWNKITNLYIPCLSGDLEHSLLDIKSSYKSSSPVIDTLGNWKGKDGSTSIATFEKNKGITLIGGVEFDASNWLTRNIDNRDVHFGLRHSGYIKAEAASYSPIVWFDNPYKHPFGYHIRNNSIVLDSKQAVEGTNNGSNYPVNAFFSMRSPEEGKVNQYAWSTADTAPIDTTNNPITVSETTSLALWFSNWDRKTISWQKIKFMTYGQALSIDEMKTYSAAIDNLMSVIENNA